jgi:hypothetical protein
VKDITTSKGRRGRVVSSRLWNLEGENPIRLDEDLVDYLARLDALAGRSAVNFDQFCIARIRRGKTRSGKDPSAHHSEEMVNSAA